MDYSSDMDRLDDWLGGLSAAQTRTKSRIVSLASVGGRRIKC